MPPTAKPPILGNKKEIPNAGEDKVDNTTQEMSDLYSQLMTRSLTDEELLRATAQAPDYRILPDVSVLSCEAYFAGAFSLRRFAADCVARDASELNSVAIFELSVLLAV